MRFATSSVRDGIAAATVAVGCAALDRLSTSGYDDPHFSVLSVLLVAISAGTLGARRTHPLAAGIVCTASQQLADVLSYPGFLNDVIAMLVLGVCASHTTRGQAILLASATAVLSLVGWLLQVPLHDIGASDVVATLALGVIPVAIGDAFRSRRQLAEEAERRAHRAEHVRALELERTRGEERLRIARDVHDVVGHHLSAISIQAGVAEQRLAAGDTSASAQAMHTVRELSSSALGETRRSLGIVRATGHGPRETAPGLGNLAALVERARDGGVEVVLCRKGTSRSLPEVVDGTAYRIVQEALTNVARHASARRIEVQVAYGTQDLSVSVIDDGIGAAAPAGYGIRGMHERAELAGGSVYAGPRPGGGWLVSATLPVQMRRA